MNKILYNNYHTHTTYCKHSSNEIEELVLLAIDQKYKKLGISEHCPYPLIAERSPNLDNLNKLIEEFIFLKDKYKKKIKLYFGLECEYFIGEHDYYQKLRNMNHVDYLIYGNHHVGDMTKKFIEFSDVKKEFILDIYYQQTLDAFKSNLFSCFAHPDLIFKIYQSWNEKTILLTHKLIELSIKYNIPFGLNGNGIYNKNSVFDYPCEYFWDLVSKSKAKVLLETDSHFYEVLLQKNNQKLFQFAKDHKLEKNLIKDMKFK